jgi:hypothetical protein
MVASQQLLKVEEWTDQINNTDKSCIRNIGESGHKLVFLLIMS